MKIEYTLLLKPVLYSAPPIPAGIHWNPPESAGIHRNPLESTGIGLESAGIHWNGTSKVQHSSYSPNGIW